MRPRKSVSDSETLIRSSVPLSETAHQSGSFPLLRARSRVSFVALRHTSGSRLLFFSLRLIMGLADPLGDALTNSLANLILSRQNPPNARLRSSTAGTSSIRDEGTTQERDAMSPSMASQSANGTRDTDAELVVSRATKTFLDFVDGDGNEVRVPKFQRAWNGRGADENKPPPLSDKQRIAQGKSRSVELWKKINPGYVTGMQHQSEYAGSLALTLERLELAKYGDKKAFKHHLAKTDTSVYVEAVARERIISKALAAEAVREMDLANAAKVSSKANSVAGDAPAAAPAEQT